MKFNEKQFQRHMGIITPKLTEMGFIQNENSPHMFSHPDLPSEIDFSATDPNKIVLKIWQEAKEAHRLGK